MTRLHAAARKTACCVALATTAACVPSGDPILLDLVESIEASESFVETALVDVGSPEGRTYLLDGWLSQDERWLGRFDETFVWADAPQSTFRFFTFEQRDLTILITLRPNPDLSVDGLLSAAAQVNGGVPADLQVTPGWEQYRIDVPGQFLQIGENRVTLLTEIATDVAAVERRLAVDLVEIERPLITYPARRELAGGRNALLLPYLSELQYRVRTSEGASLALGPVLSFGPHGDDSPGYLELLVRLGPDPDPVITRRLDATGERVVIPLPAHDDVRISLMSLPSWSASARIDIARPEEAAGMLVRRPVVQGPAISGGAGGPS